MRRPGAVPVVLITPMAGGTSVATADEAAAAEASVAPGGGSVGPSVAAPVGAEPEGVADARDGSVGALSAAASPSAEDTLAAGSTPSAADTLAAGDTPSTDDALGGDALGVRLAADEEAAAGTLGGAATKAGTSSARLFW